jgi:hypothetical protein
MGKAAICMAMSGALTAAASARAATPFDDPYDLPDAPRPPSLPELTHRDVEVTAESTIGSLRPASGNPSWTRPATSYVQRLALEAPLGVRRWFVGTAYEAAAGPVPDGRGPTKVVSGNVEAYGRTVWATRTGLAFGGGLGFTVPIASFDPGSPASRVTLAAASLRPWDFAFWDADALTLRPFADVRALDGRVVIQFREQLDWAFATGPAPRSTLAAASFLYLGLRIGDVIGAGVEAIEYYFIDAPVADDARAVLVASPSVRFLTQWVQPVLSVLTNLTDPIYPGASRVIAARLGVTVLWDPTTREVQPQREVY